eukprot:TRINITY_DN49203_c0_g1_i1.p1 TRINITY_DN49203_c0_g1~~TRINITY_DN49203_c0_g1_i1.p1  ORF type:complete len:201 (+),score=61.65 TRINITY_DN49203_c0_g1_i1:134-736(+)
MCIRDRYQRRVRGSTNGLGMGNLVCYDDNNACTTARDVAKTVYTTETDEHGVTTTTISTYDKHGKLIERARSEGGQDSETFASLRESMGLEETEDSYRMSSTSLPACNESLEEFKAAMLEGHNKYRAKHSAPEVKWSDSCARNAQLCVDHCQATGSLSHLSLIHISEPTRLLSISYAVFCLKKKKTLFTTASTLVMQCIN